MTAGGRPRRKAAPEGLRPLHWSGRGGQCYNPLDPVSEELPAWGLNTDGHIISSILGRSETVPVQDGRLVLGEFGRIYFGDLDSVRPRQRMVHFQVIGD